MSVAFVSEPKLLLTPGEPQTFPIRFPETDYGHDQHEEWCEAYIHGQWHRFRLHDYDAIYSVPGLYEHLFYTILQCSSPQQVVNLLTEVVREDNESPTQLRILDLGAGNGMVGEELRKHGVNYLAGVDIILEAKRATERDRPGMYDDYHIADMTLNDTRALQSLREANLNTLVTVAALGFGDIPPQAFANTFNAVADNGWLAFNIKETFFSGSDDSGFFRLIRSLWDKEIIQMRSYRRYVHRLSISGKPLHYVALAARKLSDVPQELVERAIAG
ncbi:MAG: hypothetical protein OHK0029_05660 [Armatimonadaceae bacterium]